MNQLYLIMIMACFFLMGAPSEAMAQTTVKNEAESSDRQPTIFRQAGDYSEKHDVLTIAVLRGTAYRAEYDKYMVFLNKKLDSLDIPHKLFQEYNEKEGTGFVYFIENDLNGMFDAKELIALLPHIQRRFKKEYLDKSQD